MYSAGIGTNIRFDTALIRDLGATVHGFDPTPATSAWLSTIEMPPGFVFHPWAVAGHDGTVTLYPRRNRRNEPSASMLTVSENEGDGLTLPALSLATIMARLGHDRIDLLKLDVEGAEYDIIPSMLEAGIQPRQLLVEFHHRFPSIGKARTVEILGSLRDAGYRVFAVSDTGREVSCLREEP